MSDRSSDLLLADIREALDKILTYTDGMDAHDFAENSLVIDAVLRNIAVMGEAASKLPEGFIHAHPEIEWRKIVGMRNRLIHAYFGVSVPLIWQTIQCHMPELRSQLDHL